MAKFDKDEWLLNRHRKRSETLLNQAGTPKKPEESVPKPPDYVPKTYGSRTIDNFGELLKKSKLKPEDRKGKVSRSSSSVADCSRPVKKVSWLETEPVNPQKSADNFLRNHATSSAIQKHRRKSEVLHCKDAGKWLEDPEFSASETDIMILERWLENMKEDRADDHLHNFQYVSEEVHHPFVIGKQSDVHGCTFDFKYQGETNDENRAHGEGSVKYRNGDQFTGTFANGKRQGRGVLMYGEEFKMKM